MLSEQHALALQAQQRAADEQLRIAQDLVRELQREVATKVYACIHTHTHTHTHSHTLTHTHSLTHTHTHTFFDPERHRLQEDRRAAAARHAEGLEKKLQHAQEEARAYLKTLEGSSEKFKEQHAGTQFTCFTGKKVPVLTPEALQSRRTRCARRRQSVLSFTGTKVPFY
jgi:hypothetical protein